MLSLQQLKDIFALLRTQKELIASVNQTGKIDFAAIVGDLHPDIINQLCAIITGEPKQYTDDILEAADIISGFFLNLSERWVRLKHLPKLGGALANLATALK